MTDNRRALWSRGPTGHRTLTGDQSDMRQYWGLITFILAALLLTAPAISSAAAKPVDAEPLGSQKLSRNLGEKGQIIIESLDLNEADLSDVVRLLARIAGINIITGDIKGSITVYLENVTVQSALEAILSSQGYGFIYDGNIVRVVDAARLGEDRVETITETFPLNYLPAETVADNLRKVFSGNQSGSSFSQIEANVEANAIIAVDIPRRIEDIRRLIHILDTRFEQVEIEGRFVEISWTQDQQYGVDWKYFQDPANTLDVNLAPGALNASNVAGQFKFAIINGKDNLTGFLQALETNNDVKVLANPKILALENKEANIELINEVPFVEANVSQGVVTESVQFQKTGITLTVTPQIAQEAEGTYIRMKLLLEQRIAGPNVVLQNSIAFPIDSRRATTELIVPDGSTIIIGGLRRSDLTYTYEKIPVLGNIPFFGLPFRRRAKNDEQAELLLFVTPYVIYEHPPLDGKEQELHDDIDHVADALETQNEWRETAEAPFEALEKNIQYSAVNCKPKQYAAARAAKDQVEKVKPYKVAKNRGQRRYRITAEGKRIESEELPPLEVEEGALLEEATPEEGAAAPSGEVRSFKEVEKQAKPGAGSSGAGWYSPDREAEPAASPLTPLVPLVPPEEEAPKDTKPKGPSWLREGARESSDASKEKLSREQANAQGAPKEEETPDLQKAGEAGTIWDAPEIGSELVEETGPSEANEVEDAIGKRIESLLREDKEKQASTGWVASTPEPLPQEPPAPAKKDLADPWGVPQPNPEPAVAKKEVKPKEVSSDAVSAPNRKETSLSTVPPPVPAPVAATSAPPEPPAPRPELKAETKVAEKPTVTVPKEVAAPATPPASVAIAAEEPKAKGSDTKSAALLLSEREAAARHHQKAGKAGAGKSDAKTHPIQVPEIQVLEGSPAPKPSPAPAEEASEPIQGPPISKADRTVPAAPKAGAAPDLTVAAAKTPERMNSSIPAAGPRKEKNEVQVMDLREAVNAASGPSLVQLLDPKMQEAIQESDPFDSGFMLPPAIAASGFYANSPNPTPILFFEDEFGARVLLGPEGKKADGAPVIAYHETEGTPTAESPSKKPRRAWWRLGGTD
ncbi:MAG: hypothetical protein HUU16_00815 [Candidatus Omnitrophica bacterium]|nr:hypothetical protein [Candidatus Omnitrophota bacterium]